MWREKNKTISAILLSCCILLTSSFMGCADENAAASEGPELKASAASEDASKIAPADTADLSMDTVLRLAYEDFAIKGMRGLQNNLKNDENLFYSPLSLYISLAVLEAGAGGETKTQLSRALWGETKPDLQRVDEFLKTLSDGSLETANSLWLQQDFVLKEQYSETIKKRFAADLYSRDFSEAGALLQEMRVWIKNKTQGLLGVDFTINISSQDRFYLLNALYFENEWLQEFDKELSRKDLFLNASGRKSSVMMMQQTATQNVLQTDRYTMASLDLEAGGFVRFALPAEGNSLAEVIRVDTFYADLMQSVSREESRSRNQIQARLEWKVPRTDTLVDLNLGEALLALGLSSLSGNEADFSEMADISKKNIQVASALQQVRVKMNETGVEAAAVTAFTMAGTVPLQEPLPTVQMHLNRPFAFAIFNADAEVVFCGLMNEIDDGTKTTQAPSAAFTATG